MSALFGFDLNYPSAIRFNAKAAREIGWYGNLPPQALAGYPDLVRDPVYGHETAQRAFVDAVYSAQVGLGFEDYECDGLLGTQTWLGIQKKYHYVPQDARWYLAGGRRLQALGAHESTLITYEEEGGLDLHRWGHFTKNHLTKHPPQMITIHWGGIDPKHCYRVFAQATRKVSSHLGVGPEATYQWLDLAHKTWHAGAPHNGRSIGIDLCQQPTTKYLQKYKDRGYDVRVIDNPSSPRRGDRRVLTLDSRIVLATQELLKDLCALYDIPFRVPRGHDGLQETGPLWYGTFTRKQASTYRGILFHNNLSKGKWDIAPWLPQLFDVET